MNLDAPMVSFGSQNTLASNLRYEKLWKVQPQTTPYLFELEGGARHEVAPGLDGEVATLFSAPLSGRSRRLRSVTLRGEENYLSLVPPVRRQALLKEPFWAEQIGELGGWLVLQLNPPEQVTPEDLRWLKSIGLEFEPPGPRLWLESAPDAFLSLPGGETVPVYDPGRAVVLQIGGQELSSSTLLIVAKNGERTVMSLPDAAGSQHRIKLEDCPDGLLVARAMCGPELSPPVQIWVGSEEPTPLPAELRISCSGKSLSSETPLDLQDSWSRLELYAPPLWMVHLCTGGRVLKGVRLRANAEGCVDLSGTLGALESEWKEHWLGKLRVSAPSLSVVDLVHFATPSEQVLASRILRLRESIDDFDLMELWEPEALWERWLQPALNLLGYECRLEAPQPELHLLLSLVLVGDPLEPRKVLDTVFVQSRADTLQGMESQTEHLRGLLRRHHASRGFLSNGRLWLCLERSRRRAPQVIDIMEFLDAEDWSKFCALFGAES